MAEPARADDVDTLQPLGYAEFGRRFFETAVTRERVIKAVGDLAGRPIEVGPLGVGPLNMVKVRASGAVGEPQVEHRPHPELVAFDLTIPAQLKMEIQLGLESYHFVAHTAIHLPTVARPVEPLQIYIDVRPPSPDDIEVQLQADGMRASLLEKFAGIEREVKRNVASFVRKEIGESRKNRLIDVERKLS